MVLLAEGLAGSALVARFEMLFKKLSDLTCQKAANANKNGYYFTRNETVIENRQLEGLW